MNLFSVQVLVDIFLGDALIFHTGTIMHSFHIRGCYKYNVKRNLVFKIDLLSNEMFPIFSPHGGSVLTSSQK